MNGRNRIEDFVDTRVSTPAKGPTEVAREGLPQIIWRRRWILFVVPLVCLAAATAYLQKAIPIYSSSSRVLVTQSGPRILSDPGLQAYSAGFLYNQCELIKSPEILKPVADMPEIQKLSTFGGKGGVLDRLAASVSSAVGKNNDLITVSFESPSPSDTAQIVNAIVQSYVAFQANQNKSTAAEVLKILQAENDKRMAEIAVKVKQMMDFKRDNATLSFDADKGNVIIQRLAKLQDALTQAQLDIVQAKATLESAKAMGGDPDRIIQLADAEQSRGMSTRWLEQEVVGQLSREKMRLQEMQQQYLTQHRAVQSSQNTIELLKTELAEERRKVAADCIAVMEQHVIACRQREKEFQAAFDEQRRLAMDLNVKATEYAMLEGDKRRLDTLCDSIDNRIKELKVNDHTAALNIDVVEVASIPYAPVKPVKAKILGMALVLGLMLGMGLALALDWMDQRIRSADEIKSMLGLQVLGVVPRIAGKQPPSVRGRTVHLLSTSDTAEAYRTIRTAIFFGNPDANIKKILVTSPAPGDGKTTSASNLAIAMAQAGQKVLLLDADFRKPTQHKIFELKIEVGLSTVIAGKATLDEAIQTTGVENLDLLPCGPLPTNPAEILNSSTFADTLELLSQRYDHVLIDSPPVVPVTDARILSALVDATVLVLRAEKSTRKVSERARDSLQSVGGQILGVVVNAVPRNRGHYGYYYGYGYSYGYGYGYGYGKSKKSEAKLLEAQVAASSSNGSNGHSTNGNGNGNH